MGVSLSLFFSFSVAEVFVGLRINNFVILTWACAAGCNNINNNNIFTKLSVYAAWYPLKGSIINGRGFGD